MSTEFRGKTVIVTGAGRGIGQGIAQHMASLGATVVAVDSVERRLTRAQESLTAVEGKVIPLVTDVTSVADLQRLVDTVLQKCGSIDYLVNNAGVARQKPFLEYDEADYVLQVDVNYKGTFFATQLCAREMVKHKKGAVVNIASISAWHYTIPHSIYSGAKAAVVTFTRDAAYELGPHGVRVNCVAPGPIDTPLAAQMGASEKAGYDSVLRLGRWGQPLDIAQAVEFLCSERSAFITGQTLSVAGGADLCVLPAKATTTQ
ncbi:SDR family oxidoreductase [Ramlibacter henchirensis]|uniref:SDR family oxidoreductase n=1 Tax=Ramlibacter henchirensis TaxID=204072 RepID=A0A4Z0BU90_9BURK|nr:SDR family NAD(P)-dependent oxidoreductase [Ramlibacter henchirensis]TFZ02866.1 SDR family oxidoreductase [Ramlibacter henchirensis]